MQVRDYNISERLKYQSIKKLLDVVILLFFPKQIFGMCITECVPSHQSTFLLDHLDTTARTGVTRTTATSATLKSTKSLCEYQVLPRSSCHQNYFSNIFYLQAKEYFLSTPLQTRIMTYFAFNSRSSLSHFVTKELISYNR